MHLRAVADGVWRVEVSRPVRQGEVASRGKGIAERGHDAVRVLLAISALLDLAESPAVGPRAGRCRR